MKGFKIRMSQADSLLCKKYPKSTGLPFPSFWDSLMENPQMWMSQTNGRELSYRFAIITDGRSAVARMTFDDNLIESSRPWLPHSWSSLCIPGCFHGLKLFYNTNGYFICYHVTNIFWDWVLASLNRSAIPVKMVIPSGNVIEATVKLERAGGARSTNFSSWFCPQEGLKQSAELQLTEKGFGPSVWIPLNFSLSWSRQFIKHTASVPGFDNLKLHHQMALVTQR